MIKWLFKYGAAIFLFNTVLLNIESTFNIGEMIFLSLMGISLFFLMINPVQIKNILFHKAFLFFLIINFINLLYFLLFHSISDYEAVKFIIARGLQFSIVSVSIYFNYEYYKDKFLSHIVYIVFGIIVFSFLLDPFIFSGRYSGIIWNPNMLAAFTITAFSILLLKNNKRTNLDYIMLFTFIVISLSTGSRSILVALGLVFLMKYGFSIRNIFYAVFSLVLTLIILSVNLDTSLNRFASQSLFNDRVLQYQYAYETFINKPIFGYGLDKYSYIDISLVPNYVKNITIMEPHNGYLAFLTQYGIIFGGIVIFIIFKKSIQFLLYFRKRESFERTFLFILIYTLLASLFETLLTGINEFHTILFWLSLSILSYSKFKEKNAI
jgi:O-antigen ligase